MALGERLAPLSRPDGLLAGFGLGCAPIGDLFTSVSEADADETVATALASRHPILRHRAALRRRAQRAPARQRASRGRARHRLDRDEGRSPDRRRGRRRRPERRRRRRAPSGTSVATACSAASNRASPGWASIGSTCSTCTTPRTSTSRSTTAIPAMLRLREEGVVRSIGVGMNYSAPLARFAAEADIDLVMVAGRYTLLDRSAEQDLLPGRRRERRRRHRRRRVQHRDPRRPQRTAPTTTTGRRRPTNSAGRGPCSSAAPTRGVRLSAAAIRFPLRHPAVAGVVVGARTADEVRQFAADARRGDSGGAVERAGCLTRRPSHPRRARAPVGHEPVRPALARERARARRPLHDRRPPRGDRRRSRSEAPSRCRRESPPRRPRGCSAQRRARTPSTSRSASCSSTRRRPSGGWARCNPSSTSSAGCPRAFACPSIGRAADWTDLDGLDALVGGPRGAGPGARAPAPAGPGRRRRRARGSASAAGHRALPPRTRRPPPRRRSGGPRSTTPDGEPQRLGEDLGPLLARRDSGRRGMPRPATRRRRGHGRVRARSPDVRQRLADVDAGREATRRSSSGRRVLLPELTPEESAAIWRRTAERIYGLPRDG